MLLIAVAAIACWSALSQLPALFAENPEIQDPGPGGWIAYATIAVQPLAAAAALVWSIQGRMRSALSALAAVSLISWLSYLPSLALHGLDLQGGLADLFVLFYVFLAPLLAFAVLGLAWRSRRLELATVLAAVPTLVGVLAVAAFALGVAVYGF
jgi:hypothetical protein